MKKRSVRPHKVAPRRNPIKGVLLDLNTQLQDYLEALKSVSNKQN